MKKYFLSIVALSYACPIFCTLFERKRAIVDLAVEQCISGELSQPMLIHIHTYTQHADSVEQLDLIFAKVPLMTALWMSYRKRPLERQAAYDECLDKLYNIEHATDLNTFKESLGLVSKKFDSSAIPCYLCYQK